MGLLSIAATGLAGLLSPFFGPPPAPTEPAVRVPAPALVSAPAGAARGTMLMVHGGGWAGPAPLSQKALMTTPGETLGQRGWRIVSVDYHAGPAALQDVLDAAGAELAQPAGGPLCIYGESAGAQLALIAAARLSSVDCVVAMGPPADFEAYQTEVQASHDPDRTTIAGQIAFVWGATPQERAPNDPIQVAGSIAADVLMLREADDPLIPIEQVDRFVAARPTTQRVELEGAPGSDPAQIYLHGTLSQAGRERYRAALGAFADRAVAADAAERAARQTGCMGVTRTIRRAGVGGLQRALVCLARRDELARRAGAALARTTSRRVAGELNAARAWNLLRSSTSGRRALAALAAGRARTSVRAGAPNRLTLRVKR